MKKHKVGFSLLGKLWIVTMGEDGKSITDIQTKFGVSYFTKFGLLTSSNKGTKLIFKTKFF